VQLSSKSQLHDLCAHMNRRHRSAQLASRASVQLHTVLYFAAEGAKVEDAYVMDVMGDDTASTSDPSDPRLRVIVPRYGIESSVKLGIASTDPLLERSKEAHSLSYGEAGRRVTVRVFDRVRVRISVQEHADHQRELVVTLVEPDLLSLSSAPSTSAPRSGDGRSKKREDAEGQLQAEPTPKKPKKE
jgi:exosome complex exonuclease DIS3/RRP44